MGRHDRAGRPSNNVPVTVEGIMKISSKSLTSSASIVLVTLAACFASAQTTNAPFSITVGGPERIKGGSTATISITVKNVTKDLIGLGFFSDPTDAKLMFAFDVRGADGRPAPETPFMKDKPLEGRFGRVNLKPGETLQMSADLNKLFDLTPGTYTIQLSRGVDDYILLPPGRPEDTDLQKPQGVQPDRRLPAPKKPGAIMRSNEIRLTVVP